MPIGKMPRLAIAYYKADATAKAYWDAFLSSEREFILNSANKILELDDDQPVSTAQLAKQIESWQRLVMSAVGYDVATHACDEDSFEYLLRVVSDIIPSTLPATAAPDTILRETFEQYVVPNDQGIYRRCMSGESCSV